jgi:hypothetical protein
MIPTCLICDHPLQSDGSCHNCYLTRSPAEIRASDQQRHDDARVKAINSRPDEGISDPVAEVVADGLIKSIRGAEAIVDNRVPTCADVCKMVIAYFACTSGYDTDSAARHIVGAASAALAREGKHHGPRGGCNGG